jgi:hypothetical protein
MSKESQVIGLSLKGFCVYFIIHHHERQGIKGVRGHPKFFFYVIEVVGSMHLMLENGFHKGDNIKHFLGTIVVLTDKLSYTTFA